MADTRKLPVPVAENWEWQEKGNCRGADGEMFFHPDGERGPARARRIRRAKASCMSCPVLEQCRTHALQTEEPFGIWGGMSEKERREAIRKSHARA